MKIVRLIGMVIISLLLIASCISSALGEESLLQVTRNPYIVYYGDKGKPSECGMDEVTLCEEHLAVALNPDGTVNIEGTLALRRDSVVDIPIYDFYRSIILLK